VLEETSYLTLSDAAVDLLDELCPGEPAPAAPRFLRSLATEHPWIELAGPGEPAAGSAPAAVRFRSPLLRLAVLGYAWTEFDGMRPTLLAWLRRQAGHPDIEVRARAAHAAGLLAREDLQHGLHRYLVPWADSDSVALRRSAALALGVVGDLTQHNSL